MYAVMRRLNNPAVTKAIVKRRGEVEDVMRGIPGFVAYTFVRTEGDGLVTLTICRERSGVEESNRRAKEWVKKNVPEAGEVQPEIAEGEVLIDLRA